MTTIYDGEKPQENKLSEDFLLHSSSNNGTQLMSKKKSNDRGLLYPLKNYLKIKN